MKSLAIYVPKPGTALHALHPAGTGFVGSPRENYLLVHYEEPGNISNIVTYEDRLNHAAGRLNENYPTSKMCAPPAEDMIQVGFVTHCEGVGWYISIITDQKSLEEWAPGPHDVGGGKDFTQRAFMRNLQGK